MPDTNLSTKQAAEARLEEQYYWGPLGVALQAAGVPISSEEDLLAAHKIARAAREQLQPKGSLLQKVAGELFQHDATGDDINNYVMSTLTEENLAAFRAMSQP